MEQTTERAAALVPDPPGCRATGCGWYHGAWPVLRSLGLVATPHRHADLFDRELGAVADAGGRRLLVSGAADPAMVELAVEAFRSRGVDPATTVLDRCATPVDAVVETQSGVRGWVTDVFAVEGPARFDALCTHGLFPLVPVARRGELAERWASMLVPGGRVVTTASLSGPDVEDPMVFDAASAEAFVDRAVDATSDSGHDPDVVAAVARTWAERAAIHPVRSPGEVEAALGPAGFDVSVEVVEIAGPVGGRGGPWSARSARYAEIVAVRR